MNDHLRACLDAALAITGRHRPAEPGPEVMLRPGPGQRPTLATQRGRVLVGVARDDEPVVLDEKAGHLLAVAAPGTGASSLLRTVGAQFAAAGYRLDVLDATGGEQSWAHGLEAVTYLDAPDAIHHHLFDLAAQVRDAVERQQSLAPRVVLVESYPTTNSLTQLRRTPEPGGYAADALAQVLAHARVAGVRVLMACRHLPPNFGHVARDLFTTRLLASADPRSWYLAGPADQRVPDPGDCDPGGWQLITRAGLKPVRAAYLTDTDAARLARHPYNGIHPEEKQP
jgi:hypothetical protein